MTAIISSKGGIIPAKGHKARQSKFVGLGLDGIFMEEEPTRPGFFFVKSDVARGVNFVEFGIGDADEVVDIVGVEDDGGVPVFIPGMDLVIFLDPAEIRVDIDGDAVVGEVLNHAEGFPVPE